jgi:hypothetical protein
MNMQRIQAAVILILAICLAQTSVAGTLTVKQGYVACEDLSTLVLALKYIKEKKDIPSGDRQFARCFRTESLSGLPLMVLDNREGYSHLLLRAEKAGERNLEFWTQSQALNQSKSVTTKAKSSK